MKIRKGRLGDCRRCVELAVEGGDPSWKLKDFQKSVKDKYIIFLVSEENRKISGFILGFIVPTKQDEALIHETMVDLKERGKKIGTKLVNALCKELFKKGVKSIYAEIEPKLLKFYRDSCKFKISGKWVEVIKRLK